MFQLKLHKEKEKYGELERATVRETEELFESLKVAYRSVHFKGLGVKEVERYHLIIDVVT